ncbi:hypothetical protein C8R43DRAFT_1138229 [Mycena crocata]|nr:hypothetical protein C8R43DRAFT_1138229 [Mycena crocata]
MDAASGLVDLLRSNFCPTEEQVVLLRQILHFQADDSMVSDLAVFIHQHSDLLDALKGALSAFRSFPSEILAHIFLFCPKTGSEWSLEPEHAPMLLSHVCSRWRAVCHGTHRLWTTVRLPRYAFAGAGAELIRRIVDHSRNIPLSVTLESPPAVIYWPGGHYVVLAEGYEPEIQGRWLDVVWNAHHRLESITLDMCEEDVTPHVFPQGIDFPMLSSLKMEFRGDNHPDFAIIFEGFQQVPLLRSLDVRSGNVGDFVVPPAFPWFQLTHLTIKVPINVAELRDIFVQCHALEIARFWDILQTEDDDPPPSLISPISLPHTSTLPHLRELDISLRWGGEVDIPIDAVGLPRLESLSISTDDPGTPAAMLVALHARSQFSLAHLSLTKQDLRPEELISVLRLLPSLQTLVINRCACITNRLFKLLTYKPGAAVAFQLSQLRTLTIHPITAALSGTRVARMVESLANYAGGPDALFPQLQSLFLYRARKANDVPEFGDAVEERLALVRATGFLVDKYPQGWRDGHH